MEKYKTKTFYSAQHDYFLQPTSVLSPVTRVIGFQPGTIVYGPTRANNGVSRGHTGGQAPVGQTQNQNNQNSATKRQNQNQNNGGQFPIGQPGQNQRSGISPNIGNTAGIVTNGQSWNDQNQNNGFIVVPVQNAEDRNSGLSQNQNTGIESNDDNVDSYAFLGRKDIENTDKPQNVTVQLRLNNQRFPNPYRTGRPQQNQQNRQTNNNRNQGENIPNPNTRNQGENIVVTNNPYCTAIAKELIKKGGNVREVFIAASLCEGFVHPMDSGLGGGFQAVYYNFENNRPNTVFIDSREKSPGSSKFTKSPTKIGGNSIAIPTVLSGYEQIYNIERHKNRLKWSDIIKPVFDLCQQGFHMSKATKEMIQVLIGNYNQTQVRENKLYVPKYCDTLVQISLDGPSSSMYRAEGHLHKKLIQDLRGVKSTITSKDILNNRARTSQPSVTKFEKYTVYSTKSPGSGQAALFALKIIERLRQILSTRTTTGDEKVVYLLKILKYTYTLQPHLRELSEDKINKIINEASSSLADGIVKAGFKLQSSIPTKFGDVTLPKLQSPASQGTTNIVIKIGKSAITASSSINSLFGSGIFSETMGFFYNNHLRDFSAPNWRLRDKPLKNAPGPNKVPSSSISPVIMVDDSTGEPVFQIGSAGGSHILSAMINTMFNYFILNKSLQDSVDACRIMPKFNYLRNKVSYLYECKNNEETANRLRSIGVDYKFSKTAGYAAVTTLSKLRRGVPEAVFDSRRGGSSYVQ
ncbi:scoloptoxin SSD14-like [Chrysoperla carnea]|uniref:scoloptoxin SSD14-like n=1 Tax=Chrysoperla carnea TaxID=189513 RepID=UPI001D08E0E1|nr:scoloptoxin SSD14-like [Chrysoperla carnea]